MVVTVADDELLIVTLNSTFEPLITPSNVPSIDPVATADSSIVVTVVPSCINKYRPTWYADPCVICARIDADRKLAFAKLPVLVALVDETDVSVSETPPPPPPLDPAILTSRVFVAAK